MLNEGTNGDLSKTECPLCVDIFDDPVMTTCGHLFCRGCLETHLSQHREIEGAPCPVCAKPVQPEQLSQVDDMMPEAGGAAAAAAAKPSKRKKRPRSSGSMSSGSGSGASSRSSTPPVPASSPMPVGAPANGTSEAPVALSLASPGELSALNGGPSTKVRALLDTLRASRKEEPDAKTIVFSQFTSMLDMVEDPLRQAGFKFVRYDGRLSNKDRTGRCGDAVIISFSRTSLCCSDCPTIATHSQSHRHNQLSWTSCARTRR